MSATFAVHTLGCKVNQYESEAIVEAMQVKGFILTTDAAAEIHIINTCTVTAESDRKARQLIRRLLKSNPQARVLVTGCLAQTAPEALATIPGVDFVCGNRNKMAIVKAACALIEKEKPTVATIEVPPLDGAGFEPMTICSFARTRAYIKIEDGCESRCTYCIIPDARGHIRSKPMDEVLNEVRTLTEGGCREIVLTGIETASYGRDLSDGTDLATLLEAVDRIPNIGRIRLGSLDPTIMRPAFVERIARLSSLAPHFHLSMQSGSSAVLARMKRKYNREQALVAIDRLHAAIPHAMLTTDIIVGFPGETEEDFAQTMELARRARFLMIHVFPYSKRAGTLAATLPDQIPNAVKKQRVATLSAYSAAVRTELLNEIIARSEPVSVLFETYEDGIAVGHTPDFIEVHVPSPHPLHAETHTVRLTTLTADGIGCIGQLFSPT